MALNPEQESIAQAIANGGNPHTASIHSANYRSAAQNYNKQKGNELDTRVSNLRTELQANISSVCTNFSFKKYTYINLN